MVSQEDILKGDWDAILKAAKEEMPAQEQPIAKEEYSPEDTELGKAFYALKQIHKKVNKGKQDYEGAFNDLEMLKRISKELINKEKESSYKPLFLANTNRIKGLMEGASKIGNTFYSEMEQLSNQFRKGVNPEQLKSVESNPKYLYTAYDKGYGKKDVLSKEGKAAYEQEATKGQLLLY